MSSVKREFCSGCRQKEFLKPVIEFGSIPLAGYFPSIEQIRDEQSYDCNLLFCDNCGLLQVDTIVNPEVLFRDYRYMSSIGLTKHFTNVAAYLDKRFGLRERSRAVIEFGSNDGVLLKPFDDLGVKATGFEPSLNISQVAKDKGCNVIVDFFNYDNAVKYGLKESAQIVVANNVFAHINDLTAVIEGIKYCLEEDGSFVAEVHYLLNLVEGNQYDFIYHEHMFYHSVFSLNNLFRLHGMTLYDFDLIDTHSGSIRIFAKKGIAEMPEVIRLQIEKEREAGIVSSGEFLAFANTIKKHIADCREAIHQLRAQGRKIIGFGASGRCNIFCNLLGLGTADVKYIFDQSPERVNRFIPACNIPVVQFTEEAAADQYDVVLVFAWNYYNMISSKINAKDYLVLFPQPQLLKKEQQLNNVL